jgi:hypothetical protein
MGQFPQTRQFKEDIFPIGQDPVAQHLELG